MDVITASKGGLADWAWSRAEAMVLSASLQRMLADDLVHMQENKLRRLLVFLSRRLRTDMTGVAATCGFPAVHGTCQNQASSPIQACLKQQCKKAL